MKLKDILKKLVAGLSFLFAAISANAQKVNSPVVANDFILSSPKEANEYKHDCESRWRSPVFAGEAWQSPLAAAAAIYLSFQSA